MKCRSKKIKFTCCLHWVEIVVKRGSIVPGLEDCNDDNDNGEGGADPNGDTDGDDDYHDNDVDDEEIADAKEDLLITAWHCVSRI